MAARSEMKIELYSVPNDENAKLIKIFLTENKLKFHETIINDIRLLDKMVKVSLSGRISLLRIKYSHAIHIIRGFDEHNLNQLLEHVKKYNPEIE